MKLVTFTHDGRTRVGLAREDAVVDLSAAAPDLPTDMLAFLEAGPSAMDAARAAIDSSATLPLADVKLDLSTMLG